MFAQIISSKNESMDDTQSIIDEDVMFMILSIDTQGFYRPRALRLDGFHLQSLTLR